MDNWKNSKSVSFDFYLYLVLSERGQALSVPAQLTSHWLLAEACPTHRHTSSLPWMCVIVNGPPPMHFSWRGRLMRNAQCLHVKRLLCNVGSLHSVVKDILICLVARLPKAAIFSIVKALYTLLTLADAAQIETKTHCRCKVH